MCQKTQIKEQMKKGSTDTKDQPVLPKQPEYKDKPVPDAQSSIPTDK